MCPEVGRGDGEEASCRVRRSAAFKHQDPLGSGGRMMTRPALLKQKLLFYQLISLIKVKNVLQLRRRRRDENINHWSPVKAKQISPFLTRNLLMQTVRVKERSEIAIMSRNYAGKN